MDMSLFAGLDQTCCQSFDLGQKLFQSQRQPAYLNQLGQQANQEPQPHYTQLLAGLQAASCREEPKPTVTTKGKSVFSEIAKDVKSFVIEHRGTLYFIAMALVIDHLLFKDAFRHRLQGMADKVISKVEAKIDQ